MIEETKKAAKVNRDVSISEVADLTILRESAEGAWDQGQVGRFHLVSSGTGSI